MSALALRILACVCMLLDHIGMVFAGRYPALSVLRWIGRLAFPLYAFLVAEGFRHTSNRLRYALRLAIFTVLSQLPYALFLNKALFNQLNVFATLLISLLTVWAMDALGTRRLLRIFAFLPALIVVLLDLYGVFRSDYGARGVLLVCFFYLLPHRSLLLIPGILFSTYWSKLLSLAYVLFSLVRGQAFVLPRFSQWELVQLFSLLALIPIWLYNGERGRLPQKKSAAKCVQLGFYAFYPLHLLVLCLLRSV